MIDSGKMMTIARPYAAAAFAVASAKKALPAWETFLQSAASITQDDSVRQLFLNPTGKQTGLVDLYLDLLKPQLDSEKTNFLRILAENSRLNVLPQIAQLYGEARTEAEKKITVTVTSAVELEKSYEAKLVKALTKRLEREVYLQTEVDKTLLGGVIVRAGDIVIDGSIRGKLLRLNEFI
jgi:F-type H+-transporting ATPase subunit delta